jgi:hypothetical protein
MQEKRRLARHHQYKASLVEEAPRPDNAVIPDAPPKQQPATQQPPESLSLPPPPEANRAVCRLGIGDQQSAESTQHQQTALCVFSAYHAYFFIYAENTHIGCMRI